MKFFGMTDKGKVRQDNQDSFIIEYCEPKDCVVAALCDGMGGAKAGGLASQLSNKEFVNYVYGKLNDGIHKVNAVDNLIPHNAEYIYFHTDHHWTALGAYYAYQAFCVEKGVM